MHGEDGDQHNKGADVVVGSETGDSATAPGPAARTAALPGGPSHSGLDISL